MSYSDDQFSSAQPFSGGDGGDMFDAPDVMLKTPYAKERTVDTQSGFLVVVKTERGGQQITVRRRLGTPPSSTLTLTPDESLSLARILADGVVISRGRVSTGLSRLARALNAEGTSEITADAGSGLIVSGAKLTFIIFVTFIVGGVAGYLVSGVL